MATTKAKPTTKVEPIIATGDLDITLPPPPVVGAKSKYPFDDLDVNRFFSVKNKDRRSLLTSVKAANKRWLSETKDASGAVVGSVQEREFYAVDVDAETAKALKGSPHEGATVLVIRSK